MRHKAGRRDTEATRLVVAIDGPAGAGKSTIAKRVAAKLGFLYVDTGAMYRAVGLKAMRSGVALDEEQKLAQLAREARIELGCSPERISLDGEDVTEAIRSPEVSDAASRVSATSGVRRALVEKQKRMGDRASLVMEGRDIGSVVFPRAEVKVFLDASPAKRAERRVRELIEKGTAERLDQVARDMEERDRRDTSRSDSPLVRAPDAVYIDSTSLTLDEVEETILEIVRNRTSVGKE